ncbi:MAG: septum formation initiator family protein [Candidatus Symbiothrix sp.]|jgi:cell division protein FtsB|nr:septum formation initiator family protein [Candidatus Symbiothrix sp.]
MKRLLQILRLIVGNLNKYWIAVIVFVFFIIFVGENTTIIDRFSYDRQIRQLETEIKYYTQQKEENAQKLKVLQSDNESLEKLAREQYQMTKPDEELFIIKE